LGRNESIADAIFASRQKIVGRASIGISQKTRSKPGQSQRVGIWNAWRRKLALLLVKGKAQGGTGIPQAGDRFKFFFQPDGAVVILPRIPTSAFKDSVPKASRPISDFVIF
jgi:hypothetical protein